MDEANKRIEVTCEQLGLILLKWTIEASKISFEELNTFEGLDVGKMSEHEKKKLGDEIVKLTMFAITYAVQQQVTDPNVRQTILDSYHGHAGKSLEFVGMETGERASFENALQERYKAYYDALRKDSEARRIGTIPWYIGKTAAEYVFGHSRDLLWITQLFMQFGSTLKATKDLLSRYKLLADKKNGKE